MRLKKIWTIPLLQLTFLLTKTQSRHYITETKDETTSDNRRMLVPTFHNSLDIVVEESESQDSLDSNKENESSSDNSNNNIGNSSNNLTINASESPPYGKFNDTNRGRIFSNTNQNGKSAEEVLVEKREIEEAVEFGLKAMKELIEEKEPKWYKMGLYLDKHDPASHVADFGAPNSKRVLQLANLGYAALEASKKIATLHPEDVSRQSAGALFDTRLLDEECPLRGLPRCTAASKRYRTADGTCNNFKKPWKGAAPLPFQRFLSPVYEDGLQEIRRSVFNTPLPSAREISQEIHRDRDLELPTINLMFMQWGQLIDHDITSTVKSRSFNGSVPRCCRRNAQSPLPPDLLHPNCLPITVPANDRFLSRFGIGCIEFIRSAPSTRIDCDLGWREQINQVTSYVDASVVYGSNVDTSDSIRTFRSGKLFYGRPQGREPLQPPDPPGGELCRSGALTSECFQGGDGRFSEQPGLVALHTVLLRYHNRLAEILNQLNDHWSDEKVYQETRRIVAALVQHITYREFLPIVLGQEVMDLFELNVERKGFYKGYDERVNPGISNSFSTAAFRFGHSLVQNSFVRFDTNHRPLFNNVSLHEEQENIENIWSFGSLDRILLGFCNQPSQRRDEFICEELTNHLFQSGASPFGMDLAAINVQRGRDHGLPPYTSWREPCGLKPIESWIDLETIMSFDAVRRLKLIYEHFDDIDLFTAGLAEKPVRGGLVGPTFACIIAQQFLNLRKGDRFWYENGGFESSFTPAQLQQVRRVTLAHVMCQTLTEIETIQPFVFLTADNLRNLRLNCNSPIINNFDLAPWIEESFIDNNINSVREGRKKKKNRNSNKKRTTTTTTIRTPIKIRITNVTTQTVNLQDKEYADIPHRPTFNNQNSYYQTNKRRTTTPRYDDVTYLFGYVRDTTPKPKTTQPKPIEVNIKIQYYPPTTSTTTTTTQRPYYYIINKKPAQSQLTNLQSDNSYPIFVHQSKPLTTTRPQTFNRPQTDYYGSSDTNSDIYSDDFTIYRPTKDKYQDRPFSTSKRPYIYRPNSNHYIYNDVYTTRKPSYNYYDNDRYDATNDRDETIDKIYSQVYMTRPEKPVKIYSIGHVQKINYENINDKLDFQTLTRRGEGVNKYVKISSVKGEELISGTNPVHKFYVAQQREGELDLEGNDKSVKNDDMRLVDLQLIPNENRWMIFNVTKEEDVELMKIPDFNSNFTCTNELPRPISAKIVPEAKNVTMT